MDLNSLLHSAVAAGASDLHLKVGSYPMMRVNGTLTVASEERRLDRPDTEAFAEQVFTPELRDKFKHAQEVDLAYSIPGLGRLLVEGGGVTVSRFLAAGTLDRLYLTVTPMIVGDGRPGLQLARSSFSHSDPRIFLRMPRRIHWCATARK